MIVYLITNEVTGKYYVGQTSYSLDQRFKAHMRIVKSGGVCRKLYASIRKHGKGNFTAQVLSEAKTTDELDNLEKLWITCLNATDLEVGYNIAPGGAVNRGFKWSKESRDKLSKANMGNQYGKGAVCSEEKREKIRASLIGHTVSEETRKKISKARALQPDPKGWHHTEEAKRKMSLAKRNRGIHG